METQDKAASNDSETYTPTAYKAEKVSVCGKYFGNAADVWMDARHVAKEETREHFLVYFLDTRHRLIGERWTMAIGSATGVEVHPRELFSEALKRTAAGKAVSSILLAHNHPSGDPEPSRQDLELTRRLRECGELLGIRILDHVVVSAENGYVSLAERNGF